NNAVSVETEEGSGSEYSNEEYAEMRAIVVNSSKEAWANDLIMKVKEPVKSEYDFLEEGQIIFTYFHLASQPELTKVLIDKKVIAIAYETVQLPDRSLPLLTPMSEVAGYMATQIGAQYLEKPSAGNGV